MGAGRPTQWHATDITIKGIFGVPEDALPMRFGFEGRGPDDGYPVDVAREHIVLCHASFRRRFEVVPADGYIGIVALGFYLGVSRLTIERKLAEVFGRAGWPWRSVLAVHGQNDDVPPALKDSRYRWGFVVDELEPSLAADIARAAARRALLRQRAKWGPERTPATSGLAGLHLPQQFLVNASNQVVGSLGQAHLSAITFIQTLDAGGRVAKFEPVAALSLPWTTPEARDAWDDALRAAIAYHSDRMLERLDIGEALTNRAWLDAMRTPKSRDRDECPPPG